MPDSSEDSDPGRDLCLDALARGCEAARFDVRRRREAPSLRMTAVFHQHSARYALIRKATLWAAETHEYLYAYAPSDLDSALWRAILDDVLARGLAAIRPHDEHMTSYISAVLLCRSWHADAADAVRRARFVRSFRWGLRGWARLRTIAVRLPDAEQVPAACVCNASARNALLPLIRSALSPLFTL